MFIKDTENIVQTNSFKYCGVCRMMSPVFKFYDDEIQEYKTFCKICLYCTDVKPDDDTISQLNLSAGYINE